MGKIRSPGYENILGWISPRIRRLSIDVGCATFGKTHDQGHGNTW